MVIGKPVEEVFAISQDIENAAKFQNGVDPVVMVGRAARMVGG